MNKYISLFVLTLFLFSKSCFGIGNAFQVNWTNDSPGTLLILGPYIDAYVPIEKGHFYKSVPSLTFLAARNVPHVNLEERCISSEKELSEKCISLIFTAQDDEKEYDCPDKALHKLCKKKDDVTHAALIATSEAIENNNIATLEALIKGGDATFINIPPFGLCTFLSLASRKGNLAIIQFLLDHGADIHASDDLALTSATDHGHYEVAKILLEHGANVHAQNEHALRYPCYSHKLWEEPKNVPSIIRLLLAHGANWNVLEAYKQAEYRKLLEKYPEQPDQSVLSSSE